MLAPLAFLIVLQEKGPLDRMADAMAGHRAVSFTIVGGVGSHEETMRARFLAPNLYAIVSRTNESRSDGESAWTVSPESRRYTRRNAATGLREVMGIPGFGLVFPDAPKTRLNGVPKGEELLGKPVVAVPVANGPGMPPDETIVLLLDPQTNLPRGMRGERGGKTYETYRFEDVVLDPPLTPRDFRYAPPAGYTDSDAPVAVPPPAPRKSGRLIMGKPGVWTGEGYPPLRLVAKPRPVGKDWAFEVESRTADAYTWKGAEAAAGGKALYVGTVVARPGGRRATILTPRSEGVLPTELSLYFPRQKVWFRFEWKE